MTCNRSLVENVDAEKKDGEVFYGGEAFCSMQREVCSVVYSAV